MPPSLTAVPKRWLEHSASSPSGPTVLHLPPPRFARNCRLATHPSSRQLEPGMPTRAKMFFRGLHRSRYALANGCVHSRPGMCDFLGDGLIR